MKKLLAGLIIWLVVLGLAGQARAQESSTGAAALAVPVAGEAVITNMSPNQVHVTWILVGAHVSATQEVAVRVTVPVVGLPLTADMSVPIVTSGTQIYFWGSSKTTGRANNVTFRSPAGNIVATVVVNIPVQGASYDPGQIDIHVMGAEGTGMFEGIRMAGALKGLFHPTGTLYLSYSSPEAALQAIRGGLAQNNALTDAQRQTYLDQAQQALAQARMTTFPADQVFSAGQDLPAQSGAAGPPAQAQVTNTTSQNGGQASVVVRVVVPAGPAQQTVKVVSIASDGSVKTIVDGVHAPGEVVTATASGTPPFIVQVYVNNTMVKQIEARGQ